MASYKVPSFEEATTFLVTLWKALFPTANVGSRFTYHWKRLRAYAAGVTDLHAHIQSAQNDVMPDTSTGSYLTRWGNISGVAKKGATGARRAAALRVFGLPGKGVAVGDELLHEASGHTFEVTKAATIPTSGQVETDVQATTTGASTRLLAGESLKFVSPPDGIQASASLVLDLNEGGEDAEQDVSYSTRVNRRLSTVASGGNQDDFELWCLQQPNIAYAKAYPNRAGVGTLDVAAFKAGTGSSRSLTADERTALLAALKKLSPAQLGGFGGALRVLTTAADLQDVEVTMLTNGESSYDFHWNDSTAPVVLTYTTATRTVQFTANRPSGMNAGHLICFKGIASVQDGAPFTIESLSGADSIVLKETPAVNLAANDIAYSGGPLTSQIRDAIVAHMNGEIIYADRGKPLRAALAGSKVGLKVLAEGIGPSNPAGAGTTYPMGAYGTWNGSLLRSELQKIAAYSTGVRNISIAVPTADYSPAETTFPNDGTVNFVAPRLVLVRRAW